MYTVELRVDTYGADGIPHSFLVLTGPCGLLSALRCLP